MKPLKTGVIVVTALVAIFVFTGTLFAAFGQKFVSALPLPLGAPSDAAYSLPENLPMKSGGPYIGITNVKRIALAAAASNPSEEPKVVAAALTAHTLPVQTGIFSASYSVADEREVYLVVVEGSFTFLRTLPGGNPVQASHINVEIDATTGDVLAVGTSDITKDIQLVRSLAGDETQFWLNP